MSNNVVDAPLRKAGESAVATWLHLAATPAFALMAVLAAISNRDAVGMLCSPAHGMSAIGSMSVMYALMAVVHCGPWLRRLALHSTPP